MEEAKTQENAKLQSALQEVQLQFKETKEMFVQERETAKRAAEKVPIIQEVPVVDHEMMNKLSVENEKLKVGLLKQGSFKCKRLSCIQDSYLHSTLDAPFCF